MPGDHDLHCEGRIQSLRAAGRPPPTDSTAITVPARYDERTSVHGRYVPKLAKPVGIIGTLLALLA